MSEMIERVAKAIRAQIDAGPSYQITVDEYMKILARAAIEAMREPTEAMRQSGFDHMDYDEYGSNADENNKRIAESVYRAMIDAALAEKP